MTIRWPPRRQLERKGVWRKTDVLITEKASVIQCSSIPRTYCRNSTERPNDVASESTTVPTMTNAAINARMMISRTRTTVHRYFPDLECLVYQATMDAIRVLDELTVAVVTDQGTAGEAMRRVIRTFEGGIRTGGQ